MSAKIERTPAVRDFRDEVVVVDFAPEQLKAPFMLRCGALILDYILIVLFPVGGIILARFLGYDGAKIFKSNFYDAGLIIAFLLTATNFIVFPMISGQTFGKSLTGLRIVDKTGKPAGYLQIALRHLIGYPLSLITGGLGFFLSLFNAPGKALHDYLAGTLVIYGKRRVLPADE